jgi:hypothetical protein
MNYKLLSFFTLLFVISSCHVKLNAQSNDNEPNQLLKHSIGAGAGFTTGYGLSYRYRPAKFGVQVNFAPYSRNDVKTYSTGLTFLYTIIENNASNLFLYEGNHYFYNSYIGSTYVANGTYITKRYTESYVNNGVGVGIELIVAKRVGINLMGGYAFYNNFKGLNLTGETALYYKF